MGRRALAAAAAAGTLALAGAALYVARQGSAMEVPRAPSVRRIDPPPVIPWRDPDADLRRFFPGATGSRHERLALSAQLLAISRHLGRPPAAADAILDRYLIEPGSRGRVLLRRVRGEHGAIEVVVAVDARGRVLGLHLQRQREPESIARFLASPEWTRRFTGRSEADCPAPRDALRAVPAPASASALAVADGVRTLLVLDEHSTGAAATHVH